jgi:hypothetical protein
LKVGWCWYYHIFFFLSEVMAKKYSISHKTFGIFGGMFGNVIRASILGTSVLCEMNSGKALELSKSEAWFVKDRKPIEQISQVAVRHKTCGHTKQTYNGGRDQNVSENKYCS